MKTSSVVFVTINMYLVLVALGGQTELRILSKRWDDPKNPDDPEDPDDPENPDVPENLEDLDTGNHYQRQWREALLVTKSHDSCCSQPPTITSVFP